MAFGNLAGAQAYLASLARRYRSMLHGLHADMAHIILHQSCVGHHHRVVFASVAQLWPVKRCSSHTMPALWVWRWQTNSACTRWRCSWASIAHSTHCATRHLLAKIHRCMGSPTRSRPVVLTNGLCSVLPVVDACT
jgi:hypothetical protein